uniref:Uncharacterized protein MANES_12G011500 n=1 Tax=Rhizophora mucronata TaxID=61149 RepID=A0A2P2IZ98_RHIMU
MSGEIGEMEIESKNQGLKHLGFVRIAAIHALACMSSLYEYAKQNSGPLRSVVGTVEGAVTTVVGPVCQKFKGAPDDLLVFLDKKVISHLLPVYFSRRRASGQLFLICISRTGIVSSFLSIYLGVIVAVFLRYCF